MKISVVIATYNSASTLRACLASVGAQRPPVELVVIDGGSTDGTVGILQDRRDVVTTVVSEPDSGVYDALNKGVRLATGDFVLVLGSDDVLADPHVLARLAQGAKDAQVIYGDALTRDRQGVLRAHPAGALERFRFEMPISHPATLVQRTLMLTHPFGHSLASDYRQLLMLYRAGARFQYIPGVVAVFAAGGLSDRMAARSTWDRLRINFELRGWRAADVVPFYVVQTLVCWLKPKLLPVSSEQIAQ
jgi:putative colanic acid biosynthesis glycosyltransferase